MCRWSTMGRVVATHGRADRDACTPTPPPTTGRQGILARLPINRWRWRSRVGGGAREGVVSTGERYTMDNTVDQDTRTFFEAFERSSAAGDADALVDMYAASFLMAGAAGVQVVKASDLRFAIPKRKQVLASAGCPASRFFSFHDHKPTKPSPPMLPTL